MADEELCFCSAAELAALIRRREVSPVEVVQAHLARIAALNDTFRAFVHLDGEAALAQARGAEIEICSGGYRGPLHGMPVAYKDIYDVGGLPTTAGSRIMAGYVASQDSTVAARLRRAGAICLGKLNTFEFASGGMDLFGDTRNPWHTEMATGGSSSGSAASLAARLVPLALGSDTGGSIRSPAALCGLVGLKPTYGRVSRAGVVPLSWSLDHAGPMARTAADAALLLQGIAGPDARDPSAAAVRVPDYLAALDGGIRGLRLGLPRGFFFAQSDSEVVAALHAAVEVMERLGAEVREVEVPHAAYGLAASWAIAYSEAFAFHRAGFLARPREYTPAFLHKITGAACLTAEERVTAQRVREVVTAEFMAALEAVDVIVTPGSPHPAQRIGAPLPAPSGLLTRPVSLAGLPALAVPCGFSRAGLPLSAQLVGRAWQESTVLRLAHTYQEATDWHRRRPPFSGGADPGPPAQLAPQVAPAEGPLVDAGWVLDWARLIGLSYVGEADAAPIAASIAPVKAQLGAARAWLDAGVEPPSRPAPG
ncbi:MAG: hypothetical protein HY691_05665 [Chloroflexi bacterium]|nr:hypothetical protein [Chloroflexota bacterium]